MNGSVEFITIRDASVWASDFLGKTVTTNNIMYLVQYGRIKKEGNNGVTMVSKEELKKYYLTFNKKESWKEELGEDLNWALSFDQYKEAETTKHVHRLHPYKGKFIPQLVEYFLDDHIDKFKTETYFSKGDIILDPFSGSGTTMVQSCELGMHAIGIDVSAFNALIGNSKIAQYNYLDIQLEINKITQKLKAYLSESHVIDFEERLLEELYQFNNKHFPVPEYKFKLRNGEINEDQYGIEKEQEFLKTYNQLINSFKINLTNPSISGFLDKWYFPNVREEIDLIFGEIKGIQNPYTKRILSIILSRTIRSCRATTHADLATLKDPVLSTYYCSKHGKMCKPLFSILKWWETYTRDTLSRLIQFDKLRTHTHQYCLTGDSRSINILDEMNQKNPDFAVLLKNQGISGIFSSPPYVGLIDYHEQHAYAYELFGFQRHDELEIGPLSKGQGNAAKQSYIEGVSDVLNNCKKYLKPDYNIFLVSNDKYNLYPRIAEAADMMIVNQFKRPVLNRTEKDKGAYSEIIFHMKKKS